MKLHSFIFELDDFPVDYQGAYAVGSLSGRADIAYDVNDSSWSIEGIQVDGSRPLSRAEREKLTKVGEPAPSYHTKSFWIYPGEPLYSMLYGIIDGQRAADIQERVDQLVGEDRADLPNRIADRRRDERMAVSA